MNSTRTPTYPPDVDADVVEFARLGQRVSLDWTVRFRNWATFAATMQVAPGTNNFDARRVAETFKPLFDDAMSVHIGREDSTVMYVVVPFYPGQRLADRGWIGERYSDAERQDYTARVIEWGRTMRADSISVRQHPDDGKPVLGKPGPNPYRIRLWWD